MHIHPSSPNVDFNPTIQTEENAAIKIQAGFRGYRVRKQMQHQPQANAPNGQSQRCQQKIQEPFHTSINIPTPQNITSTSSSNRSTPDIENRCATKIQASVRGFLVRKQQKVAINAATKIQASFRGFKARKETDKLKQK
ncbi:abnormal spindle-like microcephaly-associated protein homolog [Anastrepha obliqua]|uniref:abnormal spindle-like microcephaly-associated protein homolog n=1 Tax=Anastrepha obliqua TaxID=95512 RepID=UPI00240A1D44|nr:abnormal spindle-like microcephaly-associated protein homolog [Anastrepha obliqua]